MAFWEILLPQFRAQDESRGHSVVEWLSVQTPFDSSSRTPDRDWAER